ncbi:tumor necrosis factor-like [Pseudophryne corroboree]|uniref:tumor necrosis factor-like n=1 Tax=Pseudophryne corroboree TaxID=495146 RepID=UPI003081631E
MLSKDKYNLQKHNYPRAQYKGNNTNHSRGKVNTKDIKMELTQVRTEEPLLLQPVQRSRTTWYHWLSICSFIILLGATIILALLHFQIIPTANKDEFQMPEVLQIKSYLDSVPQTQAMQGKRVAAHMRGVAKEGQINWQQSSAMNFFKDTDLKLTENKLEIPKDGLYLVYTQVEFTGKDCLDMKDKDLTHSVRRKSESYDNEVTILTSTKSVCETPSESSWTEPIYQGGLFILYEGDILSTETTNVQYVNSNNGKVTFGILAI